MVLRAPLNSRDLPHTQHRTDRLCRGRTDFSPGKRKPVQAAAHSHPCPGSCSDSGTCFLTLGATHHAESFACIFPLVAKGALGGSDFFPRSIGEDTSHLGSCLLTLQLQLLTDLVARGIF